MTSWCCDEWRWQQQQEEEERLKEWRSRALAAHTDDVEELHHKKKSGQNLCMKNPSILEETKSHQCHPHSSFPCLFLFHSLLLCSCRIPYTAPSLPVYICVCTHYLHMSTVLGKEGYIHINGKIKCLRSSTQANKFYILAINT